MNRSLNAHHDDFAARPERAWSPIASPGRPADSLVAPWAWPPGHRVLVSPHADLFDLAVGSEMLTKAFAAMVLCPQHTFFVQTRHPARMRRFVETITADVRALGQAGQALEGGAVLGFVRASAALTRRAGGEPGYVLPRNIWLGVVFEDQPTADARLPELLRTPAAHHWAIASPLRGAVDLAAHLQGLPGQLEMLQVVAGADELPAPMLKLLAGDEPGLGRQLRQAGVPVYLRRA